MKKYIYKKKNYKRLTIKIIKNWFIRRFKNITLKFGSVMIYIIKKKLVLLKNHLNYLKEILVKWVFKGYNRIFEKDIYIFFPQNLIMESLCSQKENRIKDITNLFRLKKELSYTAIIINQ